MPWARASALDRHLNCPAASWLPRLDRGVWSRGYLQDGAVVLPPVPGELRDTSAADHGTSMHSAKADQGEEPFQSIVEPWREKMWPARLGVHEQAVSYDCRTRAIELGPTNRPVEEMDAWKASRGPDCVVGTADWWASLPAGEPWIDDLKTGWRRPDVLTPPMLFYGLTRARTTNSSTVRLSISWWPKAADEPTREGLWYQVGPIALEAFEEELNLAWRRAVTIPNPEAHPGPWCRYCPSADVCDRAFE